MLVAVSVKALIPLMVGMPLMTPVDASRAKPGGKFPDEMAHKFGSLIANVAWIYMPPTTPSGSDTVLIIGVGGLIVMLSTWPALVPPALIAAMMNEVAPMLVGVPVITPVPAVSVNPAGRLPLVITQRVGEFDATNV